jgi:hypothetical protein
VLLRPEKHRHGVGEDRSRCPNCKLDAVSERMSDFEIEAWNWYWENASGWAARIGITARAFELLGLEGIKRKLFLEAMGMIEGMLREIAEKEG